METILPERKYQLLNQKMLGTDFVTSKNCVVSIGSAAYGGCEAAFSTNEFDREKKLVNEAVEIAMNLIEEVKNEK
jgi:hypothetical protein